jgi:hypothetical protein
MELGFQVGDLVRNRGGYLAILLERDEQTDTGEYWWKYWNIEQNRIRIVGEWELKRIS